MHIWLLKVWALGIAMPIAFILAATSGGIASAMLVVLLVFHSPALP